MYSARAHWFRPLPVAYPASLDDRPLRTILPPSPSPPFTFSHANIVRVEVGRDRHAQKAGCGCRAVAIDSASVTRAQIPKRESRTHVPLACIVVIHCCLEADALGIGSRGAHLEHVHADLSVPVLKLKIIFKKLGIFSGAGALQMTHHNRCLGTPTRPSPHKIVSSLPYYPLPHLDGTCQTAQPLIDGLLRRRVPVSSPPLFRLPSRRRCRFPPHANCGLVVIPHQAVAIDSAWPGGVPLLVVA